MTFIDLNRYFVPLKKDQESNLDIGRFWGPRVSGWLSWDDLRLRRRVILLAEAASGKTEEFRHQCDVLRETDKAAFFLRIEDLADQGTEAGLDRESTTLFEQWLGGSSEGWFFFSTLSTRPASTARASTRPSDASPKISEWLWSAPTCTSLVV